MLVLHDDVHPRTKRGQLAILASDIAGLRGAHHIGAVSDAVRDEATRCVRGEVQADGSTSHADRGSRHRLIRSDIDDLSGKGGG